MYYALTEKVIPKEWQFCGPLKDEMGRKDYIGFMFQPINNPEYDQCLPFGFDGAEEVVETCLSIKKENKDDFINYVKSLGFKKVKSWY